MSELTKNLSHFDLEVIFSASAHARVVVPNLVTLPSGTSEFKHSDYYHQMLEEDYRTTHVGIEELQPFVTAVGGSTLGRYDATHGAILNAPALLRSALLPSDNR